MARPPVLRRKIWSRRLSRRRKHLKGLHGNTQKPGGNRRSNYSCPMRTARPASHLMLRHYNVWMSWRSLREKQWQQDGQGGAALRWRALLWSFQTTAAMLREMTSAVSTGEPMHGWNDFSYGFSKLKKISRSRC